MQRKGKQKNLQFVIIQSKWFTCSLIFKKKEDSGLINCVKIKAQLWVTLRASPRDSTILPSWKRLKISLKALYVINEIRVFVDDPVNLFIFMVQGAIHRHFECRDGLKKKYDDNVNNLYDNFLYFSFPPKFRLFSCGKQHGSPFPSQSRSRHQS